MLSLILIVTKNRQKCTKILTNTKLSTKMLQQLVVIVVTIVMTVGYFWIFLIKYKPFNQTEIDYTL